MENRIKELLRVRKYLAHELVGKLVGEGISSGVISEVLWDLIGLGEVKLTEEFWVVMVG